MMNLKSAAKANPICRFSVFGVLACLVFSLEVAADVTETVRITRLAGGPIIHQGLDASIGANIQGPSLIKVPSWVAKPLGKYYLYFADHKGRYIRLAYADDLAGPWQIHMPGSLQLADSHFLTEPPTVNAEQRAQIEANFAARGVEIAHDLITEVTAPHIASPDVHIDEVNQRIVMYYHGLEALGRQVTRVATSTDGINFLADPRILGRTYFRAFQWRDMTYGLAMPGQVYRSLEPLGPFDQGPMLFNPNMRHSAVLVRADKLWVFWTQVGDAPEHIKVSTIELTEDWLDWRNSAGSEVLRPDFEWEGAAAALVPSIRSTAYGMVNQLRDPAIYVEGEDVYLLYAVAGEAGIALAKVDFVGVD
jgi:hypothetical protein